EALKKIEGIGLSNLICHYKFLASGIRKAIEEMGLTIFTQENARSDVLTVVNSPKGIHPSAIVQEIRKNYGVLIAGGQGEIADKVFRIATIGAIGERDVISVIGLLELALVKLGFLREPGKGTTAILKHFCERQNEKALYFS
ncbi:aminotransferase, partial [bacterium]|nr:aminotransferase [bacterium]